MLVAIILGVCVDDTTHFIYHVLKAKREHGDLERAVQTSVSETSVALLGRTCIFVVTNPAFFLTDILMFTQVALILVLAMIMGLAGDLFVLPALIYARARWQLKGKGNESIEYAV